MAKKHVYLPWLLNCVRESVKTRSPVIYAFNNTAQRLKSGLSVDFRRICRPCHSLRRKPEMGRVIRFLSAKETSPTECRGEIVSCHEKKKISEADRLIRSWSRAENWLPRIWPPQKKVNRLQSIIGIAITLLMVKTLDTPILSTFQHCPSDFLFQHDNHTWSQFLMSSCERAAFSMQKSDINSYLKI